MLVLLRGFSSKAKLKIWRSYIKQCLISCITDCINLQSVERTFSIPSLQPSGFQKGRSRIIQTVGKGATPICSKIPHCQSISIDISEEGLVAPLWARKTPRTNCCRSAAQYKPWLLTNDLCWGGKSCRPTISLDTRALGPETTLFRPTRT